MVKGVSKRIIVVQSPDPRIFEQAIFIVREDYVGQAGMSDKDVLRQARQAANGYLRSTRRRFPGGVLHRLRPTLYAAVGAAAAAAAWLTVHFVF